MPKGLTIILAVLVTIGLLAGALIWLIRDDQIDKMDEDDA